MQIFKNSQRLNYKSQIHDIFWIDSWYIQLHTES